MARTLAIANSQFLRSQWEVRAEESGGIETWRCRGLQRFRQWIQHRDHRPLSG
jgi:hypothetical protein